MTSLTRRDFMKTGIAAATAATVGLPVTREALAQARAAEAGWTWDKGVCRFCGTGCGIQIATKGGQIVAVKGDPDAPVNRGLNCIKGYFNGRILYGQDRLTKPLLRMKDGAFDKKGDFVPVSWERAMEEMERQAKKALALKGPTGIAMIPSGQSLIQEGYARELVRRIQQLRKDAGMEISDRIVTYVADSDLMHAVLAHFGGYVREETLSVELVQLHAAQGDKVPENLPQVSFDLDGKLVTVAIGKK